jgi:hypothetical protein
MLLSNRIREAKTHTGNQREKTRSASWIYYATIVDVNSPKCRRSGILIGNLDLKGFEERQRLNRKFKRNFEPSLIYSNKPPYACGGALPLRVAPAANSANPFLRSFDNTFAVPLLDSPREPISFGRRVSHDLC